ncbi:hypothetical protein ACLBYG_20915 [Methylobacterium sp. D53M]
MWSLDTPYERPEAPISLDPTNVLYYFDGPQIFQSKFGFLDTIFVKSDEFEESDLWLASMTDAQTIGLIEANRLSVRGAFLNDRCWIVQTDYDMNVERFWPCKIDEIPENMIPHPGVALTYGAPRVPDTVEQSTSLFSIGFKGKSLTKHGMPLSVFRGLVNSFGDIARNVLTPTDLASSRSATFDLLIGEPKFRSLVVSVTDPILNIGKIQQKLSSDKIGEEFIEEQIKEQGDAFFANLEGIVQQATMEKNARNISEGNRELVSNLRELIPSESTYIDSIEFSSSLYGDFRNVYIDRDNGEKIHKAFFSETYKNTTRAGVIVEINDESHTFLLKGARSRITTCIPNQEIYNWLIEQDEYVNGSRISVSGAFEQRTYRDRMYVNQVNMIAFP